MEGLIWPLPIVVPTRSRCFSTPRPKSKGTMGTLKTTDLSDYHPETQACQIQFRTRGRRQAFHGRIRTVKCFEDNALLKKLVSEPAQGGVVVVDGGASFGCALIGDIIASLAVKNGW